MVGVGEMRTLLSRATRASRASLVGPTFAIVGAFAGAVAIAAVGCSSDPEAAACAPAPVTAGLDLTNPPVDFTKDVKPIYETSCSDATCHGNPVGGNNTLFLGKDKPDDVYKGLVGQKSLKYAKQTLVVPGDPKASFLMLKMDGDICSLDCGSQGCGVGMPNSASGKAVPLPEDKRNVVRRWIAQGAKR